MTKEELILSIARCEEIETATTNEQHPCYDMVNVQTTQEFHLPEPWNGNPKTAKILFIGINPNYDENEYYPTKTWNDESIVDFFENRFQKSKWAKYWTYLKKWASWILENNDSSNNSNIMEQIAVTDIVHCKSHSNKDVSDSCKSYCVQKWFQNILSVFNNVEYIVVVGKDAKESMKNIAIAGKKIIYTPHSNKRGFTDEQRKADIIRQLSV